MNQRKENKKLCHVAQLINFLRTAKPKEGWHDEEEHFIVVKDEDGVFVVDIFNHDGSPRMRVMAKRPTVVLRTIINELWRE